MDKSLLDMGFAEFAEAMRPSGGINRYTLPGTEIDVHSYSVYMNGPLAEQLPANVREHEFREVMVNALTEKLGLDPDSFRDPMKVAEIVALRAAYLAAMAEVMRDMNAIVPDHVMEDCLILADKAGAMTHPWVAAQIEQQMAMAMGLGPVLAQASEVVGREVKDRAPCEVGTGRVLSQNLDFTVQQTTDGEVVTHENRRLGKVPAVGERVTVSYYRGSGQVVESLDNMRVSEPFVDTKSLDLAVRVVDGKGCEQVVLFNSMLGFNEFVQVHGLDTNMVSQAMDVRKATPKPAKQLPVRAVQGKPYIEQATGCIAVDFVEDDVQHAAMFGSVEAMEGCAKEFGISAAMLAEARQLEASGPAVSARALGEAKLALGDRLYNLGYTGCAVAAKVVEGQTTFAGKVVAEAGVFAAQDAGRGRIVVHDKRDLDKVVREGESMTVKYEKGRGRVLELERAGQGMER